MYSQKEMLGRIQHIAKEDCRIRAAYLEGDRIDPANHNPFEDYQIVFLVTDTCPFRETDVVASLFFDGFEGPCSVHPFPEPKEPHRPAWDSRKEDSLRFLVEPDTDSRILLQIRVLRQAARHLDCYKALVDKDCILPQQVLLSSPSQWIRLPENPEFQALCEQFYDAINGAARKLYGKQLVVVLEIMNQTLRPLLRTLLEWQIASTAKLPVHTGRQGEFLHRYLPDPVFNRFLQTYPKAQIADIWEALFEMADLFAETARETADTLHVPYNEAQALLCRKHLEHIFSFEKSAKLCCQKTFIRHNS